MASPSEIISGAAFRSDLQNTNRVLQSEWVTLWNEAVNSAWDACAAARPDFQVTSYDVALVSGGSASFQVPPNFHSEIDLVYAPDTDQEYSLGPFNWHNRRSPGGWQYPSIFGYGSGAGGTAMRLMGWNVYVEPARSAQGNYRLWLCPKPHVAVQIVRLATSAALPACVAAGSGPGKTLTASANGALTVDGATVLVNDKILVKNQVTTGNNGVYTVSAPGTGSTPFVLLRTPGYDAVATILGGIELGDIVAVGQSDAALPTGTTNEAKFFTLNSFTAMEAAQTWIEGAALEPVLVRFVEQLMLKMAITALKRDNRGSTAAPFEQTLMGPDGKSGIWGAMKSYFATTRTGTVQQMIDTDAQKWRGGMGGRGW